MSGEPDQRTALIRLLAQPQPPETSDGLDELEQAGLLAPRSSYSPGLTIRFGQWRMWAFVARYSGATARDSHPIPYSPPIVTKGTCSLFQLGHTICCASAE